MPDSSTTKLSMDFLTPYAVAATKAFNEATTEQLAMVSVAGLIGLYIILSSFITPIIVVVVATLVGITYVFWVIPIVAAVSALSVAGMYLLYVKWVFHEWEKAFTGHRMTRRGESCPSNQQLPDIKR